jgi:hypothetical protein
MRWHVWRLAFGAVTPYSNMLCFVDALSLLCLHVEVEKQGELRRCLNVSVQQ